MKKKLALVLTILLVCLCGAWADAPFRNHRYDSFKILPAVGGEDVVFIGNSITNMFNWWEALGSNQRVKGRGTSGAVTQEVLNNLESMIAGQPAKVFLMIGTNDLGTAGIDDPVFVAQQIETIITRIRRESPRTMVYCQSILPSGLRNGEKIVKTNQLVSDWITAKADSKVEWVDLYPLLDDGTGKIKNTANNGKSANSYDNLHLTAQGYRLWLEAIRDRLPVDCQCQIPEGIENLGSGLGGSTGMRSSYFGALPVKESDILMIGDEMIHGCEWHELLGADFKDRGSGWGYPGVNIANMTAELDAIFSGNAGKVSKQTPKAVCLYAGVADCNAGGYNEAIVKASYKTLVDGIRAKVSPTTPIFLMTLAPHPTAANNDHAKALNAYMQTLASEDAHLHLIDLYTAAMNGPVRNESCFMGAGSAYISGLGYVAFANAIKSAVNSVLKTKYTCITMKQAQSNIKRFNSRRNRYREHDNSVEDFISRSYENASWLRLTNAYNPSYVWTSKGETAPGGTALADACDTNQLFAFVGDNVKGFYIYNKVLGKAYTLSSANTTDGTAATWQKNAARPTRWFIQTTYARMGEKPGYVITTDKDDVQGLNMYGGAGGDLKYYAASDGGTHWTISIVDSEPTIIHYTVTGTKKYQDANRWVGQLKLQKGSFTSTSLVEENADGTILKAYLNKSDDELVISNFNLHGWIFSQEKLNGEYYITYTADRETEYQYLGLRPDAQWYRIPAIVSARNGDLVAIYDWRVCHGDVGFGEVDQRMRRSSDFGRTWSTEQTIADGNGGGKVFGAAFGDPALAADRESGKMTLITVSGTTVYTYATATDHNLVSVQFSEDNGLTWSEPKDITRQFWGTAGSLLADADTEDASTTFAYSGFFGSGKILQSRVTKVGDYYRLYAAMLCRGKNVQGAYVVYSDDMGHTWQLLGGDNTLKAAPGSDEPKVEELPNGDIVLSCRKYYGRYFNIWSWSALPTKASPLGAGKWGSAVDSSTIGTGIKVGSNSCNGEILSIDVQKADGTPAKLMLQSLPSGNDRSGVEIWFKDITDASTYADVTTFASDWTRGLRVSPQSPENFSAYSTMCLQQDGRIGFFYEEGPATYAMVYVPLDIEKITNGAYKGMPAEASNIKTAGNRANEQDIQQAKH